MTNPNKFQIFNPIDIDTFVYGIKVLNKMKSGDENMPYKYDGDLGDIIDSKTSKRYKIKDKAMMIDSFQLRQYGSFFGKWAHDDDPVYEKEEDDAYDDTKGYNSTFHENAYIFAFLLEDRYIIGKYKCVYGSMSIDGVTTWYDILKEATGMDPYPNYSEYGNDGKNEISKICPDYKPVVKPVVKPEKPVRPNLKSLKSGASSLSTPQTVYICIAVLFFVAGLALLIKLAIL